VTVDVDRCSEWRALASCHLDGELDELRTARLERHLLGCAPCRSWTREAAALADLFHDSMDVSAVTAPDLRTKVLRRRLVHSASAASAAAAASIAAAAVLVIGMPSAAISLFSSSGAPAVSAAPCASCTKKNALTTDGLPSPAAVAPVHVAHPFETPGLTGA
jgi:predicted anti-sigma-YlaC factor YlaD